MPNLHEDLLRADSITASPGSERSFGLVFGTVFLVAGAFPLVKGAVPHWWAIAAGVGLFLLAYIRPSVFRMPNRIWFWFGERIAAIIGPVSIGIVYYAAVVPTGLLMRAFGKDPLRKRFERDLESYWIERNPPGPNPKSLRDQF